MKPVMLDERLSLACDLYPVCRLAADIGTDHARLPAALLQRGRCQHMVLTDISPRRWITPAGRSYGAGFQIG